MKSKEEEKQKLRDFIEVWKEKKKVKQIITVREWKS